MNSIDYIRKAIIKIIKEEFMISERLGVPENIIESSQDLYEKILKELKDENIKYSETSNGFDFILYFNNLNYLISDYIIETININFQTIITKSVNKDVMVSMGFGITPKIDYKNKVMIPNFDIHNEKLENVKLNMRFAFTSEIETTNPLNRLYDFFINEKKQIISSIAHELKHAFDKFKKKEESIHSVAKYNTVQQLRFNIEELDNFLYNSYFIHFVENLVRPTEIATELKLGNIDKKGFIEFLNNNETYKRLLDIREFSYEKMKKNLLLQKEIIKKSLTHPSISENNDEYINFINSLNEKELVDYVIKLLFTNMAKLGKNIVKDMLIETMMEEFGFITDFSKINYIDSYANQYKKYGKNYDKFFEDEEKRFKFTANRILKKIHKLYDMAENNEEKTSKLHKKISDKKVNEEKNDSIKNWDLHYKLKNGENPNFKININF
jgi:hypothetical protein